MVLYIMTEIVSNHYYLILLTGLRLENAFQLSRSRLKFCKSCANNWDVFSIMHINARSLLKSLDKLKLIMMNMQTHFVIGVTETWLNDATSELVNIMGTILFQTIGYRNQVEELVFMDLYQNMDPPVDSVHGPFHGPGPWTIPVDHPSSLMSRFDPN